jgi:hypothetical protein
MSVVQKLIIKSSRLLTALNKYIILYETYRSPILLNSLDKSPVNPGLLYFTIAGNYFVSQTSALAPKIAASDSLK